MLTAIFIITTIICAKGWFKQTIFANAMMIYFARKGYPMPEVEDLEECSTLALRIMLHRRKELR